MAEVKLAINGRLYGIACDDGQEKRVAVLGRYIDARLKDIARAGGASNESHLLVLTALVLADEVHDLREDLESTMRALRLKNLESAKRPSEDNMPAPARSEVQTPATDTADAPIVDAIESIAKRLDSIAQRVESEAA